MNPFVAKILYHTHDKWQIDIKYRDDLLKLLNFCISHRKTKTEEILADLIRQVEEEKKLLITKGILNELNRRMPEVMKDYFIVYDNNKLIKYQEEFNKK